MLYPVEKETESLLWICPQCGKLIRFSNSRAAELTTHSGMCRDCRARNTLQKHPELAWIFDDFSSRSGYRYSFLENEETSKYRPVKENILQFRLYR